MGDERGRTLGNFVVEREIGRGGMGIVLLARQPSLDRPAVLKKLRRELADSPELKERFDREARAAAAVHHENVVAVYDYFRHRQDQYIAQEYVPGLDLHSALQRAGQFPPRVVALIGLAVARGLEEIHSCGTVHRDLKPQNILLGQRGEVKIADFGIALAASSSALTMPGTALGSPKYMSPEHMLGERVDARSDLFSLGVVLYELLSGDSPYPEPREDDSESLLHRMQRESYTSLARAAPGTPRWLSRLVKRCLRGKARRRVASASWVRRELERRLGFPSPADARTELATWLWEHHVHEATRDETIVRVAVEAQPGPARVGLRSWVLASVVCALALGTLMLVEARPDGAGATSKPPGVVAAAAARLREIGGEIRRGIAEEPRDAIPPDELAQDEAGDEISRDEPQQQPSAEAPAEGAQPADAEPEEQPEEAVSG